jgi:TrkA domain protein
VAQLYTPTRNQRLLWTGIQLWPERPIFHEVVTYTVHGPVDPALFERALRTVQERIDTFRAVVDTVDGEPAIRFRDTLDFELLHLDFSDRSDPDAFRRILVLGDKDARTLAEILGGSRVAEELAQLQQRIEGLAIDWLPVREDSPYAGRTIGDARVRTLTGVSIVAVLRGEHAVPAPGPEFALEAGDYLVVVGTPRGIEEVVELLHRG